METADSGELLVVAEIDGAATHPSDEPTMLSGMLRRWLADLSMSAGGVLRAVDLSALSPPRSPAPHGYLLIAAPERSIPVNRIQATGVTRAYRPITGWIGDRTLATSCDLWDLTVFYVLSRPHPAHEEEFNDWYSRRHLQDVIAADGIAAARRYREVAAAPDEQAGRYLALYVFDADPVAALTSLAAVRESGRLPISPALGEVTAYVYRPAHPCE